MKTASCCYAVCLLILLSCKGINFAERRDESSSSSSATAPHDTSPPDTDDPEDSVALEPTSVGGAFLGCFMDPQVEPDLVKDLNESIEAVTVGCQAFDDSNFTRVLGRGPLVLEGVSVQSSRGSMPVAFKALDRHPRWAWVTRIPTSTLHRKIYFSIRASAESLPVRLTVELLDILPASVASGPLGLSGGTYKLRVKGSAQCLSGNAAWGWDQVAQKPITEGLKLAACTEGFSFQFSNFQTGFRLHVPHPNPPACDTDSTSPELCGQSCMDLENYGLGTRFVLWLCTGSVEAQRYSLSPGTQGAIRLQANGRFINLKDSVILPEPAAAAEFELIPSPAAD